MKKSVTTIQKSVNNLEYIPRVFRNPFNVERIGYIQDKTESRIFHPRLFRMNALLLKINSIETERGKGKRKMVSRQGLEPWTTALKGRCSTD